MKRDPKHVVMYILTIGIMFLLLLIVLADFSTSFRAGRPPDAGVIELIKMSLTGLIGIIAGWFAGRTVNLDEDKSDD